MDGYPEANLRHYAFMLEGLKEAAAALAARAASGSCSRRSGRGGAGSRPGRGADRLRPRRLQGAWRRRVAEAAGRQVIQVEGEVVVPVEAASDKAEIGARCGRRSCACARVVPAAAARAPAGAGSLGLELASDLDPADVEGCLRSLRLDSSVPR